MHGKRCKHITKRAITTILCAYIELGICGCGTIDNEQIDVLRSEGYAIEQVDDQSFRITEEDVEYYFKNGLFRPAFEKAVVRMPSKKKDAKDGQQVEITISRESGNKLSVVYCCPCNLKDAAGNETVQDEYMVFEFKDGFTGENLTNDRGFADIEGDYQFFTSQYMTPDDLSTVYDRGLQLEGAP